MCLYRGSTKGEERRQTKKREPNQIAIPGTQRRRISMEFIAGE